MGFGVLPAVVVRPIRSVHGLKSVNHPRPDPIQRVQADRLCNERTNTKTLFHDNREAV